MSNSVTVQPQPGFALMLSSACPMFLSANACRRVTPRSTVPASYTGSGTSRLGAGGAGAPPSSARATQARERSTSAARPVFIAMLCRRCDACASTRGSRTRRASRGLRARRRHLGRDAPSPATCARPPTPMAVAVLSLTLTAVMATPSAAAAVDRVGGGVGRELPVVVAQVARGKHSPGIAGSPSGFRRETSLGVSKQ